MTPYLQGARQLLLTINKLTQSRMQKKSELLRSTCGLWVSKDAFDGMQVFILMDLP